MEEYSIWDDSASENVEIIQLKPFFRLVEYALVTLNCFLATKFLNETSETVYCCTAHSLD